MKRTAYSLILVIIVIINLTACGGNIPAAGEPAITQIPQTESSIVNNAGSSETEKPMQQAEPTAIQLIKATPVKSADIVNENESGNSKVTLCFPGEWKVTENSYSSGYNEYEFQNKQDKNIGMFLRVGRSSDDINKNGAMPNHSIVTEAYSIRSVLGDGNLYVMDTDYFDENGKKAFKAVNGEKVRVTFKQIYTLIPINNPKAQYLESYCLDIMVPVDETRNYTTYRKIAMDILGIKELEPVSDK